MVTSSIEQALPKGYLLQYYRIDKIIGGGGFSVVYKATDMQAGQEVVIKEFLPMDRAHRLDDASLEFVSEDSTDPSAEGIRRFFNEAGALSRVDHPNIVKVLNVFRANNTVYMVMDYHRGRDLRWYIKKYSGRMSEKFILTVFPQLLEGLGAMHKSKLLHLDIKPANVLIRTGGRPLLLDFGAARESLATRERGGLHTLTLGYAPLEQHRNSYIGAWSDMYAVGATIYACMAGKAPPPSTERDVKDTLKPAVKKFRSRYSRHLLEAVDWCLLMDQTQRPQHIGELLEFLNREWLDEDNPGLMDQLRDWIPWLDDKGRT